MGHLERFSIAMLFAVPLLAVCVGCTTFKGPWDYNRHHVVNIHSVPSPTSQSSYQNWSAEDSLIWPVKNPRVSQPFAPPSNPKHDGIDLRGSLNTPIYAAHSGRVVYVGRKYSGYGKMILLAGPNGLATLYAHLNSYVVKKGQIIQAGQVIGAMGRTGRASGVHLHFEVLLNKIPVNPLVRLPNQDQMIGDR